MKDYQLIPLEYQGWVFLLFLVIAFIAMAYALYLMVKYPEGLHNHIAASKKMDKTAK